MKLEVKELSGRLIAAVPVPFKSDGEIDQYDLHKYAEWMIERPVGGVAVWAHTGRGLKLSDRAQDQVLSSWRKQISNDQVLIAAAGSRAESSTVAAVIDSAVRMGRRAAELGADGLLAHPPVAFRNHPDRDSLVVAYHHALEESGLPILLFYLYEAAGGISYSPQLLSKLLVMPHVLGIKVATLDRIMTFQDLARVVQTHAETKLLLSGEDRFLGYSYMCGAAAALVGMGAACTDLQVDHLASYQSGDASRFLALNTFVDDLAQHTFVAPLEGYIQRMLWCLVHQGVISIDSAYDPWGPTLDPGEFERLGQCVDRIEQAYSTFKR